MDVLSLPLEALIPHRSSMKLIDRLVSFDRDERAAVCEFKVRERFTHASVAIEYMAQAAAVLAGIFDKLNCESDSPRIGYLMGSRKLALDFAAFEVGKTYTVQVKELFSDENTGSFEAFIFDGENKIASAILNAFRP